MQEEDWWWSVAALQHTLSRAVLRVVELDDTDMKALNDMSWRVETCTRRVWDKVLQLWDGGALLCAATAAKDR